MDIYCGVCTRYVGDIGSAKLLKKLVYVCPGCFVGTSGVVVEEDLSSLPGKLEFDKLIYKIINTKQI